MKKIINLLLVVVLSIFLIPKAFATNSVVIESVTLKEIVKIVDKDVNKIINNHSKELINNNEKCIQKFYK